MLALTALSATLLAAALLSQPAQEHAPPAELAAPAATAPRIVGEIGRRIAAAAPGETIEIPPGVYREHIRIDKPITLVGVGRPIIDGGGESGQDLVEITSPGVTIRGFLIRNTGTNLDRENAGIRAVAARATIEDNILQDILFGIDLRNAPESIIRNNRVGGKDLDIARRGDNIRLWRSDNTLIENNVFHDGRDAIIWYSQGVTVRGNKGFRCRYGLHLMFSDSVVIEENEFSENSVGVYLMYSKVVELRRNRLLRNRGPSGYGIGLKETDQFTVRDNLIAANRVGVYLDGSPFTDLKPGEFTRNTLAHNDIGFTFLPSVRGNVIWENNFIDNIEQVSVSGRGRLDANQFWKDDRGNFWTDYTGYDQDQNGVGDWVHESETLFENLMDREPKLRILLFSPVQQAVEFVGRALPAIRPEPKFVDEVPLMAPVAIDVAPSGAPSPTAGLAAAAAGLLGLGAGLVLLAGPGRPPRRPRLPRRSFTHSAASTAPSPRGAA